VSRARLGAGARTTVGNLSAGGGSPEEDWRQKSRNMIIRPGDGTPQGERLRRAMADSRWREAEYGGYDLVFGPVAIEEIVRVINPAALGLEAVSDRRFAARHGDFIKILRVTAFKGSSCGLEWGVSLPYVPLTLNRPFRYGRTLKSARLSLRWGSFRDSTALHARYIGTSHGTRAVRDDADEVWRVSRQAALAFWSQTCDLQGVLRTAVQQMSEPGARNFLPCAAAVAALTAARLGAERRARELADAAPAHGDEGESLTELIGEQLSLSAEP
jgi:hypothetical protein